MADKKPEKEVKEIKKIDSVEEIFEDKIGSLDNFVQRISLDNQKGLKNFLLKGNVSLNQVEISPIQDLEDLPKEEGKEKEEKIKYEIINENKGKYENTTKDEKITPSKKTLLSPEDFLENHKRIYSPQNPRKNFEQTTKDSQDFSKASMIKINDINREMKEKYKEKNYNAII